MGDQGHDAVHAAELNLHRAQDLEILMRAKAERRTIITADLDYPRLLAQLRTADPSIILSRDGDWSDADVIGRLSAVLSILEETEVSNSIVVVERDRIRRRRLPIDP